MLVFRVGMVMLFKLRVPRGTGLEALDVFSLLPFIMGVTPPELFPFSLFAG